MANGRFPDITGQEYDPLWARQMAEQDIPRVPAQVQQAPDLNIGPVRLNGSGLDSAALAVYQALQNQRQPQNALGSFAQGLAGGLAGGRVRQMQGRQAANEDERKRVVGDDIERRKQAAAYGRSLAQHRWNMQRDAAKEAAKAKTDDGDAATVLTPQMHADAAKNGIIIPKERIGHKVKWSELTGKKTGSDEPSMTPEDIATWGDFVAKGGQIPSFGMGASALRTQVLASAARSIRASGGDLLTNRMVTNGMRSSYANLRKMFDGASAYESTALKNTTVLEEALKGLKETGSPLLNAPLRAWANKVKGSTEIAAFKTATQVVVPEFARLLNSPTLAGVLSDTARQEIAHILDPNATVEQIQASLRILKIDAENRRRSYEDQMKLLETSMNELGNDNPPPPPPPAPKTPEDANPNVPGGLGAQIKAKIDAARGRKK